MDVDPLISDEERNNLLPNYDNSDESDSQATDSEDESIFYDANEVFPITAEDYAVENEVIFSFLIRFYFYIY